MKINTIKQLVLLLERSNLTEIEIKTGEETIRLSRQSSTVVPSVIPPMVQEKIQPMDIVSQGLVSTNPTQQVSHLSSEHSQEPPEGHWIKSPMVGTIYFASSPNAPPFVTLGQTVNRGEVLCTIEAMKMFNEIEADRSGKILKILVENAQAVEYGQPLFLMQSTDK